MLWTGAAVQLKQVWTAAGVHRSIRGLRASGWVLFLADGCCAALVPGKYAGWELPASYLGTYQLLANMGFIEDGSCSMMDLQEHIPCTQGTLQVQPPFHSFHTSDPLSSRVMSQVAEFLA